MRVTQVMFSAGYGGGERLFVDLSLSMAERGHPIQAICHPDFHGIPQLHHKNIAVSYLKIRNDWSPLARHRLIAHLRGFEPDIIHSHMARAAAVAGSVGRKLHIPTIANLHNYVNLKYYRKIDHFIPGTEDQRRYLEKGGVKTECISLVPHFTRMPGVDEPNLVESSPPIFASFGRFVEIKGFHVLLRSIRILHDRGVQAKLLLGGDGPERTNLERLAKDLAIDDFVKFTGWVDSVPQFLSQSPYFVLPSLSEAFGIATLEAMAQGKAIIAAAAKGPQQILDENVAYLCPVNDPEGLASALQEAIDNFDHARQKARNALELYKSTYAPPKVIPLFESVYEKLKKTERGT